ncbi:MAG: DUF4097 family beta strand repeat protein, partial [Candidatus Eremiobacteraeota bacterium]|nr:DUF4097 family beta strand repeat protein [Candidatus Eremiobacteraeota bacterium]
MIRAPDKAALQRIAVSADRTDDSVRIRTQYPTTLFSFGGRTEGRVDYEIRVPGSIAVTVSDVDGDVTVSGVDGDIGAASISGDISASTGSGNLNLKTTSGAAAGTAHTVTAASQLSVGSVSGDVSLRIPRHAGANITARSVSGDFSSNL